MSLRVEGDSSSSGEQAHTHSFRVEEFRRPEFEVRTSIGEGPYFVGSSAEASVSASYFSGGGLPGAAVSWSVSASPARFAPPNRRGFHFGSWSDWWTFSRDNPSDTHAQLEAVTDAEGSQALRIDFESARPIRSYRVAISATITDVNRQSQRTGQDILVHPAALYVGLRTPRAFVRTGDPIPVDVLVTDLDGVAAAGREVRLRAVRLRDVFEEGTWRQQEVDLQQVSIQSGIEPARCSFSTKTGGLYRIQASVLDDRGRENVTEYRVWVAGTSLDPPAREGRELEIVPDRQSYSPGDTAEILLGAPSYPAEGLLTLRHWGIVHSERFRVEGPSHVLRVPLTDRHVPAVEVHVTLSGIAAAEPRGGRVASATSSVSLEVLADRYRLSVRAVPRESVLAPGAETAIDVAVQDAEGRPASGAETAVVVADEAVLSLLDYRLEDPVNAFFYPRAHRVWDLSLWTNVFRADPERKPTMKEVLFGMWLSRVSPCCCSSAEIGATVRADFNPLALFAPSIFTDEDGRAAVRLKLPGNLTRYRVMAVAAAGAKRFGLGESSITARLDLMVRPSPPRFLNYGDRVELPVVVQNLADHPSDVRLAARASNASLSEGAGRRVTIPAKDRVEIRFPVTTASPGIARFQFIGSAEIGTDAAEISIPVRTPATVEAFAAYGEIDRGAVVQRVQVPPGVIPRFGGLDLTTSSTQLQALADAVLYLVSYPYECSEQLASRVLAISALREVLESLGSRDLPPVEELRETLARDVRKLESLQNEDGGFPYWTRGKKSDPYLSVHVAHSLVRAREKGFPVGKDALDEVREYLRDIRREIPAEYPTAVRTSIESYALYVRHLMGDRDATAARDLVTRSKGGPLSVEALGWLLPVLSGDRNSAAQVAAIRRELDNRVERTAATAHFTASYQDGNHLLLHSDRRADAIILDALITDQPDSDLIPMLVRGLLAHRTAGRWSTTQENVFVLLALSRYFSTFEKTVPDFTARAWLGSRLAAEERFRGRSLDRRQLTIPLAVLDGPGRQADVVLDKEGVGRLYYRLGLDYAPSNPDLKPVDRGFTVERTYEAVERPEDVRRDADGAWHVRAGAPVRVRVTMATPARRYHVALVDALPAGFEILNRALRTTPEVPEEEREEGSRRPWWSQYWYEHQNLRDDRAEAFAALLWEGVYEYVYIARATTPGSFVVPPPRAEEMYQPETNGRGATDRVLIEAGARREM